MEWLKGQAELEAPEEVKDMVSGPGGAGGPLRLLQDFMSI